MTVWPTNTNPVLTVFRENFDTGDKLSCTVSFLFALCDVATLFDVEIPEELEFRQSMFGADEDNDEYQSIIGLMSASMYVHQPMELEDFRRHVGHALKVLAKYDSQLRLAGWNL